MQFLEKLLFKISGRKVPVIQVKDVEHQRIKTLRLGRWFDNPNTLLEKWDVDGAQKTDKGMITLIDESGLSQVAYVEYLGQTVDLWVSKGFEDVPNREKIIGAGLATDKFAELLDQGKSMKNMLIGIFIGMALWAMLLGPILSAMAK